MSEGVTVALVTAGATVLVVIVNGVFGVLLVLVNRRLRRVQADTSASRWQLENDHVADPDKTTNLRDEVTGIGGQVKRLHGRVDALTNLLSDTISRVAGTEDGIRELTGPRPGKGKHL